MNDNIKKEISPAIQHEIDSIARLKMTLSTVPLAIGRLSNIEVASLVKVPDDESSDTNPMSVYAGWNPDAASMAKVLKHSHQIDMHEFMYLVGQNPA